MDILRALGTFVRIVEAGSFSAVARENNSSASTVTRLIDRLETHLGMRLLHRTTGQRRNATASFIELRAT